MASLDDLTVEELISIARGQITIPRSNLRPKAVLIAFLESHANPTLRMQLQDAAVAKRGTNVTGHRRTRTEQQFERRVAQRATMVEPRDSTKYLELPTEEEIKQCYKQFFEATSNKAVVAMVCGVCGQEVYTMEEKVATVPLSKVPHSERLAPHPPHPRHQLFNGMLLDPAGVLTEKGLVHICGSCLRSLQKSSAKGHPPRLSLANNLWIGPIPPELEPLSIPEQLLVALHYPRVYVFKLYPKNGLAGIDETTLQNAMRGTVSTYELDLDGMTEMLGGNLMPRRPAVLASLLTITFVGQGRLPKAWLHNTFRVRRPVVARALEWFRAHNTKYYGNITISEEILWELPEDDVPQEIMGIIRQSTDTGVIDQEASGYIPEGEDEESTGKESNKLTSISTDDIL